MYESKLTRQALPEKEYRELLGTALCVFASNNAFVIENILHTDATKYNWYDLNDLTSGQLSPVVKATISLNAGNNIANLYDDIVCRRNRIIHSFQITNKAGKQRLQSKTKVKEGNVQIEITEKYLIEFIQLNQKLSDALYLYRDNLSQMP